jgi:hypothetical protein
MKVTYLSDHTYNRYILWEVLCPLAYYNRIYRVHLRLLLHLPLFLVLLLLPVVFLDLCFHRFLLIA